MSLRVFAGAVLMSVCCTLAAQEAQRPQPLKSGLDFTGPEVQELQKDDFANPGMLWVTRGETLWQQAAGRENKSCASCHGDAKTSMKGVATRYPQIDRATAKLINLEGRIQQCQQRHQQAEPFKYETEGLLGLTAYIAMQSRGMPKNVVIDMQNRRHFEAGRAMPSGQLGQEAGARDHQPGARRGVSDLPARVADDGLAAPQVQELRVRRACRAYSAGLARVPRPGVVSRVARDGPADRNAGRAALTTLRVSAAMR